MDVCILTSAFFLLYEINDSLYVPSLFKLSVCVNNGYIDATLNTHYTHTLCLHVLYNTVLLFAPLLLLQNGSHLMDPSGQRRTSSLKLPSLRRRLRSVLMQRSRSLRLTLSLLESHNFICTDLIYFRQWNNDSQCLENYRARFMRKKQSYQNKLQF